ncbi:hypothetical protein V1507DRAFT_446527, partial [Lipomyces tetrasporus]
MSEISHAVYYDSDAHESDIVNTVKERTCKLLSPFPPVQKNWYRTGKYSLDADRDNTINGTMLTEISTQSRDIPDSAGVAFNANLVLDWQVLGRAGGISLAGSSITTICTMGKALCELALPESAEFDHVTIDLKCWNQPLNIKAVEDFSFLVESRTFCLTYSKFSAISLVFLPQTQSHHSPSRDEKSSASTESQLVLSDALQFAHYITAIDAYQWTHNAQLELSRARWVDFTR